MVARAQQRGERRGRRRRLWLAGAALLAFAVGIARGLRETEPAVAPELSPGAATAPPPAEAAPPPTPSALPRAAAVPSPEQELRAALEADIARHLPDRKLSSDQLDAAADALVRLRDARRALAALPRTAENASLRRELHDAIAQASADFQYLVDLDPAAFVATVSDGLER
jgi:hypothetical protein